MLSGDFTGLSPAAVIPSQPVRTKVERAVEAIESLTNAVVTLRDKPDDDRAAAMRDVITARHECSEALTDFLAPTLRVVR